MRIVKRRELMELPSGTLYVEMNGGFPIGDLCIKGKSSSGDFTMRSIAWASSHDFGETIERFSAMFADSSVSFPAEADYGRDGMFDDDQSFLVFEQADVVSIVDDLRKAYQL